MTDRLKERLAEFYYVEDYGDCDAMVHPDICDEALARITQLEALLQKVLDYRDGKRPYDFHRLPSDQRDNECFDAWQILESELRAALHQGDRKP